MAKTVADIQQAALTPDQIIKIIIRRRWYIILPFCVSLTIGLYLSFTLPRTYQAKTSILVQPQEVPGSYVRSIVSTGINARISTISQQIMSRSNLEKIIERFDLFAGRNFEEMYLEDKIESIRKRIKVNLTRSRRGADAFSISYSGTDPDKVTRITNTLSSYFMNENLKLREAQAIGTSDFLDSELAKTRKKLEMHEKKLSMYRAKYLGGLPDELESNLRTLDRFQQQLTDKQAALRELMHARNVLESRIAEIQERASLNSVEYDSEGNEKILSENERNLKQAEKVLDSFLLKYTEQHPDIKRLRAIIAKLTKSVEQENKETNIRQQSQKTADARENEITTSFKIKNAATKQQMQLKQVNRQVNLLGSDIRKIEEKMNSYQKKVEDTPNREQELLSLKRDYSNIRDIYNSLLDRKLEAELSVNMEKKQKGEQFRILDHARLPEKPISPDIKKMLIFSLAAGLGLAGGIIFLFEVFDKSIRRDEDIEEKLGLPILASISPLKKTGSVLKDRIEKIAVLGFVMYGSALLSVFLVLDAKGINKTVNFIKMHIKF